MPNVTRFLQFNRIPSSMLNPRVAPVLLVGIILLGTLGFRLIEGFDWVDSLYMSIITISTVGFGEIAPLSDGGRLFVSVFILVNVAVFAYVLAVFSYYIIEGNVFKNMHLAQIRRGITRLNNHTIICGYGRYGHEIADYMRSNRQSFVVIEQNEEKIENLRGEGPPLLFVVGDATHDEILEAAGIQRAGSLITALGDDTDNLFIVLSARQLNPALRIISRAKEERTRKKMLRAGANHVIKPEQIGGFYMAALISKPNAVEFFSFIANELTSDIGFGEIRFVDLADEYRGLTIRELALRSSTGVNIISYRKPNGDYAVNPGPDVVMENGGSFIVVGNDNQLAKLKQYLIKQ